MKTELELLLEEIAKLRERVAVLEARPQVIQAPPWPNPWRDDRWTVPNIGTPPWFPPYTITC